MSADENNLIWIDLEMTGLDPERDRIIEIATLVTDANLNVLAEGPTIAVHQSDEQLALMDDWNVRTHTGSGLVDRVKASTLGDREAELATIEFLKQWVPQGKSPICGNSIGQDRRDNDNLIDIGGNGFYAVVEVGARQNRRALMHGFHDTFHRHAFCRGFTRTPYHAVTGHQRADSAADITAVNVAIG